MKIAILILLIYKLALNEMINGMVRRTIGKEQFWISNSISAAITMLLFYGVQGKHT